MKTPFSNIFQKGFTLVELLVVIAIIGVLSTMVIGNFSNSQVKARDARRKSDLKQIQNALEMYYNDHNMYPLSSNGKIVADELVDWGDAFTEGNVTYMAELPQDPKTSMYYRYEAAADGKWYYLFAPLENTRAITTHYPYECIEDTPSSCAFGISSPNTRLPDGD